MTRHYRQLTQAQRYHIEILLSQNISPRTIAGIIGVHHSTVYRELSRNKDHEVIYQAEKAEEKSHCRRSSAAKFCKYNHWLGKKMYEALILGWSLEQLRSRLAIEHPTENVSLPTFYRYAKQNVIQGRSLNQMLPRYNKKRWKRPKRNAGKGIIPDRIDITQRPKIVESRTRIGDWEGDTVHGKSEHFVTLVDRKTRLTLVEKVNNLRAETVCNALSEMLEKVRHKITLTLDNGGEFAAHKMVTEGTGVKVYFAKPNASYQRGTNENTNGLLRREWPKGSDFKDVSDEALSLFLNLLNLRPRLVLQGRTPIEAYLQKSVALIT